eukprot:8212002-Alexandrium_andersonii.AAC.1
MLPRISCLVPLRILRVPHLRSCAVGVPASPSGVNASALPPSARGQSWGGGHSSGSCPRPSPSPVAAVA